MRVELPVRERGICCDVRLDLEPATVAAGVELLKALADPARLQIIAALRVATDPICVCDFTAALGLSQGTISHHMGKLRQAGLVRVTKQGVWSFYQLDPGLPAATRRFLQDAVSIGSVRG
ncbi:MAG: ArsR/SmtB family transcription factor [Candidatus Dormibacteria bacterium]